MIRLPLLALLAASAVLVSGCETLPWTPMKLDSIHAGMTKAEVSTVLGAPARIRNEGAGQVWEYCRAGIFLDDYVAVHFKGEHAASTETRPDTDWGECESRVSTGGIPSG